jgi:hypothetical protein
MTWLFGKCPPLTCAQVREILKLLGFEKDPNKSTGHEHWRKIVNSELFKVTVSCHNQPFSGLVLASMAAQAGLSKKQFCALADKKNQKRFKKDELKITHKRA